MRFVTFGDSKKPAVLFFHAMGVTGESSSPVARHLQDDYYCIMPTSSVYCAGQRYVSKTDELRQIEDFLRCQGMERLALVVASSIGADLAAAFLSQTELPVGHVYFDGGQFAQIGKATRRIMTPFLYLAIKSLYWSNGATLKKIMWCDDDAIKPYFIEAGKALSYGDLRRQMGDSLVDEPFPPLPEELQRRTFFAFGSAEEHYKYRDAVMRSYPEAHFPVLRGHDHMQFQILDPKGFAEMLKTIIETGEFSKNQEDDMKLRIEKNSVQETLVIPMYARKKCTELYPNLFRDDTAAELLDKVDYDFSALERKSGSLMQRFGFLECAMRQNDLAIEVREYLGAHPNAAVVNLGCGLDTTGRSCDNGSCNIYNLDFPEVIKVRNELLPAGEREENVPCDLNDTAWFERIDASGGAVFFAAGVFYYFLKEQVRSLVCKMADAFPGGVLVFDAANKKAVKLMLKTWIKDAQIKDVGAYFAVADAKAELSPWDERLSVSSRGYMLGYNDLTDPSVSGFFRFLSRVGDNSMNMQIVKLKFGK